MNIDQLPDNPYLLLTPGPLSTTKAVKSVMLQDWCTWDQDYNDIVQGIRSRLTTLATASSGYTTVLMQGSGTFCVEAAITTAVPRDGKLLVLANGSYGLRMEKIAQAQGIDHIVLNSREMNTPDLNLLNNTLARDRAITHVAAVHCETTTGMLNPAKEIGQVVKKHGRIFILDAMSSFGGVPMDLADIGADFMISSANKCIQGVPGFGFVIAAEQVLEKTQGQARSLSLDIYDQWRTMEKGQGKWRFTSPTHVVLAFEKALDELEEEGGILARWERYASNNVLLIENMKTLGFTPLLPRSCQSPIITAFLNPEHEAFDFKQFYEQLKAQGFVIYPGKVTSMNTFRIGNIGDIHTPDIQNLVKAVENAMFWTGVRRNLM